MTIDAQCFREEYARLETEELLRIARGELTETARAVMVDILGSRGVSADTMQAARTEELAIMAKQAVRQQRLAPLETRLAALLIDWVAMVVLAAILALPAKLFFEMAYQTAVLVLAWGYFFLRDGIPGQSLGKRLMSIRTVQYDTDQRAGYMHSLWRNASHAVIVVDSIVALGSRRMRLGDMIAGTQVVNRQDPLP